jgi:hypothetical protein
MKEVGNTEGAFGAAMGTKAAHQPWMGALVTMNSSPDSFAGDFWLTSARAPFDLPRRGERLWDAVLALVFVAACAVMGWAGAVLL